MLLLFFHCVLYSLKNVNCICLQDTVSVHRPGFYAQRFQDFMAKTVFKKIPSRKYHPNQPLLTNLTSMLTLNKAHS